MWSAASQGDLPRTISAFGEFQAAWRKLHDRLSAPRRCYQADGEWDKTIANCRAILRIDLRNAAAFSMRGECRCYKREYDKALANCDQALAIDPNCADAYVNRGGSRAAKARTRQGAGRLRQRPAARPQIRQRLPRTRPRLVGQGRSSTGPSATGRKPYRCTPGDWKLLNNVGVGSWQKAQEQDRLAARAEAAGDLQAAKASRGDVNGGGKQGPGEVEPRHSPFAPRRPTSSAIWGMPIRRPTISVPPSGSRPGRGGLQPGGAAPQQSRPRLNRSKQSRSRRDRGENQRRRPTRTTAIQAGKICDAAKAQRDAAVAGI